MFTASHPVWAKGRADELNLFLEFLIEIPDNAQTIRMTASTAYQLFLDGACIAYGPARAGDGYFRVDEWSVRGAKSLRALVAGYAACSFQYAYHPSFLNLEILDADGNALLATGRDEILCREYAPHLQRVDRYSRQRMFVESYDFRRECAQALPLEIQADPHYLPRGVKPFSNAVILPVRTAGEVDVSIQAFDESLLRDGISPMNSDKYISPGKGRWFDSMQCFLYRELNTLAFGTAHAAGKGAIAAGKARIYEWDANRAGQIGLDCTAQEESELYLLFDEMLTDGDVNPLRYTAVNAVKLILPKGAHRFLSFEPYGFKVLKIAVTKGCIDVARVYMLEQAGEKTKPRHFDDPAMQRIYDAGCNTFRQNATDVFMDCPSRERAGWLCDSFFTARSEYALTGGCRVETNFLENFWRNTGFRMPENAPEGFVPMLYPGETTYIPEYIINWNLWLILQLEEYARDRGGNPEIVKGLKPLVDGILNAMARLENEYGLAEDLPGWVFVEWSRANDEDVVCGVNYPSNMLYSAALAAAGRLYADPSRSEKSARLRDAIRRMSFNGKYFADNAVRVDGQLQRTNTTTEVCQDYAFFFGIATPEEDPELWDTFLHRFGPARKQYNSCPDVPFANAFIGNYLRMDVLQRCGCREQLRSELVDYFDFMAQATGTLWEHDNPSASCSHGFASMAAVYAE